MKNYNEEKTEYDKAVAAREEALKNPTYRTSSDAFDKTDINEFLSDVDLSKVSYITVFDENVSKVDTSSLHKLTAEEAEAYYQPILDANVGDETYRSILKTHIEQVKSGKADDYLVKKGDTFTFDNVFVDNGKIKIIDFERSMYAPRDFELDIFYRMIRKPWKFASEESEEYTEAGQYSNVMSYVNKYYSEIVNTPNLYERLGIYDIVYFLAQLVKHPELDELKNDVLSAAKIVTSKDEKNNRKI